MGNSENGKIRFAFPINDVSCLERREVAQGACDKRLNTHLEQSLTVHARLHVCVHARAPSLYTEDVRKPKALLEGNRFSRPANWVQKLTQEPRRCAISPFLLLNNDRQAQRFC